MASNPEIDDHDLEAEIIDRTPTDPCPRRQSPPMGMHAVRQGCGSIAWDTAEIISD
jgi:hypothetical protein